MEWDEAKSEANRRQRGFGGMSMRNTSRISGEAYPAGSARIDILWSRLFAIGVDFLGTAQRPRRFVFTAEDDEVC